jgi:hypothetical protein
MSIFFLNDGSKKSIQLDWEIGKLAVQSLKGKEMYGETRFSEQSL